MQIPCLETFVVWVRLGEPPVYDGPITSHADKLVLSL